MIGFYGAVKDQQLNFTCTCITDVFKCQHAYNADGRPMHRLSENCSSIQVAIVVYTDAHCDVIV
jgi:hypothetical protein